MKVYLERIKDEGLELEGEEAAEVLACEDGAVRFEQPLHYKLLATVSSGSLLVQGQLWTEAKLECSLCLKKFAQPMRVEKFLFYHELDGQTVFDLTENLREDILLQLPQRALCTPTCKGLCPRCGQNLNVKSCKCKPVGDVRWDALSKLKL